MLLRTLSDSPVPVVISVVASCRILAAAFNREPELVRAKTARVLLNAGSCGDGTEVREWNVLIDPAAYLQVWRSGLPIDWYPCSTQEGAFNLGDNERGTYWNAVHEELFAGLHPLLCGWFGYSFSGNGRGDILRALGDCGRAIPWTHLQSARRNLWSTASLVAAAGRVLVREPEGWRFRRTRPADGREIWDWRLDPIAAEIDEHAVVAWRQMPEPRTQAGPALFRRQAGAFYGRAMAEALNALLLAMPL